MMNKNKANSKYALGDVMTCRLSNEKHHEKSTIC